MKNRVKIVLRRVWFTQEQYDYLRKVFSDRNGNRCNIVINAKFMHWPMIKRVPATTTSVSEMVPA